MAETEVSDTRKIEMEDQIQEVRNDFLRKLVRVTERMVDNFSNAMCELEEASSGLEYELEEIKEMFTDPEQLTLSV